MNPASQSLNTRLLNLLLALLVSLAPLAPTLAARHRQDPVTGAFTGRVSEAEDDKPIVGALVEITNVETGFTHRRKTKANGDWRQDLLPSGIYDIRVTAPGFLPHTKRVVNYATQSNTVIPVPVKLARLGTGSVVKVAPAPTPTQAVATGGRGVGGERQELPSLLLNRSDARRGGNFTTYEISTLPLGSRTLIRTFDELAFILPGVALPPQSVGNVEGPGVGAGLGTAGQFVVNGFSGRTHNFMVDGSDNNDEEVGVRRQGYLTLVPQPIESLSQYSIMTLLSPASFGRNIGAQVNAISRRGEIAFHGTVYGFLNSSNLNARNFFDTANGTENQEQTAGNNQPVFLNNFAGSVFPFTFIGSERFKVRNQSGGKESFTLGQFGAVFGGPLVPSKKAFFFLSAERQVLNANEERHFIVPTLEERGVFELGAQGLFVNPFLDQDDPGFLVRSFVQTLPGAAVFSLFPFPNNPGGPFDANTYTTVLPASGRGTIFSGRVDTDFSGMGGVHSFAARYNFTDDERILPSTGGALFSSVRPLTRTHNVSTYLNTTFGGQETARPASNQIRFSYGTTSLNFQEVRDPRLLPSELFPNQPFLLNARYIENNTLPDAPGVPNSGQVNLAQYPLNSTRRTAEALLGPVGRVTIAGFSPVGVDVNNLPQSRNTGTFQISDVFSFPVRQRFNFTVGGDIRPIRLDSDIASNSRTELNFGGILVCGDTCVGQDRFFISPLNAAAVGATSSARLSLARTDTELNLRYTQYNAFGHVEFRMRPNLNIYLGLRYEYNTPIRDTNRRIESAYSDPDLALVPFLSRELSGKTTIFESDVNNFSPRFGVVYSRNIFGENSTVFRFGYGAYYDQILGAAVTRARNIFPNFVVVNFPGGTCPNPDDSLCIPAPDGSEGFGIFNPYRGQVGGVPLVAPGTLNRFNPNLDLETLINALNNQFPGDNLDVFLPNFLGSQDDRFRTPVGNHVSFGIEQELGRKTALSAAYVGSFGAYLLAATTPFGGNNSTALLLSGNIPNGGTPSFEGVMLNPRQRFTGLETNRVPPGAIFSLGGLNFSRYDSMQLSLRGQLGGPFNGMSYSVAYTLSRALDESSDFIDTAHSPALPQCSFFIDCPADERKAFGLASFFTIPGEYAPADFDSRHRFAYSLIYDLPSMRGENSVVRAIFGNLQIASTGEYQSARPFTVNTVNDVNLDGNLTDRPNTTSGIEVTGDGSQPVRLTTADTNSLLAPLFANGAVERNSFRGADYLNLNLAITKSFNVFRDNRLLFRTEIFNFLNRANFGIPERYLESPGFGRASNTITPGRRVQFSLKYSF